ncbi:MAG: AAA family ATPase [Sulfuricurvum sp.]|jgi:predicted ATP-binding protein involved in virulence
MELVYLWVESYKNIKNQGFNFSPRFECNYDGENLTIKPKDHIENFFGDNINITAIVGENGSGKSGILDFISLILLSNEKEYHYFLICSENENDLVIYKNFDKEIKDVNKKIKDHNKIQTDNIIDDYKNLSSLHIDKHEKNYSPIENIDNILNIIGNTKKYPRVKFINDSTKFFLPTIVRINIENKRTTPDERNEVDTLNREILSSLGEKNYDKCLENIKSILSIFENTKYEPLGHGSIIENILRNSKIYKNLIYDSNIGQTDKEYLDFLNKLSKLDVDIELLDNGKSFKNLSFGEQYLLKQLHTILNSFDIKKVNITTHSYWNDEVDEREDSDETIKIEKYFLFIDEFELGLHPNWQKKALTYMIDFLKLFDVKIDLFITSHSPFILSDLPKENVVFLEKYKKDEDKNQKEGNCKNVTKETNIETFGANIHTLLSHGFFMKDGLMGEFAKGKINLIKEFYDDVIKYKDNKDELVASRCIYDDKKNEFWKIQEIIGEPFLKTIMGNYLLEIEKILFEEKAKENEMNRFIEKFGKDELKKYLDAQK